MSSFIDYNFILSLLSIQTNLYSIGGPILIGLGMVSNILSLIVFSRKNLRKNPCSIYFMAFNIANIVYIYSSLLPSILYIGYNSRDTAYNLVLCRFQTYMAFVFNSICPFCLILASIDRILITSPNVVTRRRSTRRLACILIISSAIFWMLFSIPVIIFTTILESELEGFYCSAMPGVYTTVVTYAALIKNIVNPGLMIIFGLWAVKNIRHIGHVAIAPSNLPTDRNQIRGRPHSVHAKDRQLILMLFIDISIYVLFSSYLAIVLLYRYFTQYAIQSPEESIIQTLIFTVALYSVHIPFCITSYAHLLVSKTFRNELKSIFLCR